MSILSKGGVTLLLLLAGVSAVAVWLRSGPRTPARAARRARLGAVADWVCYYGADREVLRRARSDCLVLEADHLGRPDPGERDGRILLAYLSLGEVHETRPYRAALAGTDALAAVGTPWQGSHRTDLRSARCREILLREAERLLALGYDGLFLDTLDQAVALEEENPSAFAGAARAAADIVRELRRRHPEAFLVMNGGFAVFDRIAPALDAVAVEGVRATHTGPGGRCRPRCPEERAWLERQLARAGSAGLPVFALEYVPPGASARVLAETAAAARNLGACPALGTIDLTAWPPGVARTEVAEATASAGGG